MLEKYIPKHKMDYGSVKQLKRLTLYEIEIIKDQLLEWVEDINWPIAQDICDLLVPLDYKLVEPLKKILSGDDETWADNCLVYIVKRLSKKAIQELEPELEKIAFKPTEDEIELGMHIVAAEILKK